jgi:hypothetical protein
MNYVVLKLQQSLNLKKNMLIQLSPGASTSHFCLIIIHLSILNRLNRPEKTKPCEKCEEFEKMLDSERKSNAQLKRLIEQKENSKQQQPTTTTHSGPCTRCSELKQLLDIEKQNNLQLTEQLKSEKKQTEEERNAKEVFFIKNLFLFLFISIYLDS